MKDLLQLQKVIEKWEKHFFFVCVTLKSDLSGIVQVRNKGDKYNTTVFTFNSIEQFFNCDIKDVKMNPEVYG